MKGYVFDEYPDHRWCRETGSSSLVCLHCGANLSYSHKDGITTETFNEPGPKITLDVLLEFGKGCNCGD